MKFDEMIDDEYYGYREEVLSEMEAWAQEMEAEEGGKLGDPRRCPRHPGVVTSSPDGMHDGLCGACEFEMDYPEGPIGYGVPSKFDDDLPF